MFPKALILGGGQLGLMMAEAGARLGLVVDRFDPERNVLIPGTSDFTVDVSLEQCLERYDVISVEREAFPAEGISSALAHSEKSVAATALEVLPDRQLQKALLDRLQVPTSPWCSLNTEGDLEKARADMGAVVIKARRGGYDGRGLWMVDNDEHDAPVQALLGAAIIEKKIPFQRELSIVGARNAQGQCVFYPLVRNWHVDGILCLTVAPALAVTDDVQVQAEQALANLMTELDYVGVMAVEFFLADGQLLVNEIAPRVHNSGHWSQEGADVGQFELHVRALTGLPITKPVVNQHAAMVNLIGVEFDPSWLKRSGVVHWYGKSVRPGRKVGHVNLTAGTFEALAEQIQQWLDVLPEGANAILDNEINQD